MKTLGFMRIKNEERWILRVIKSMLPVCERILILDDNSTDDTASICEAFPQVTLFHSTFEGINEVRDKNVLMERLEEIAKEGDAIVHCDGDEEIAAGSHEQIRRIASSDRQNDAWRFHILYLWDTPDQIRVDGIYRDFWRPSMFRFHPGARFVSHTPGGFHCGNAPEPRNIVRMPAEILHYGYLHREDRIRKWNWYNSIDPVNRSEGYDDRFPERRCYPHIVQGDIPEVPANARLMHAGPLQLESLKILA